MFKKIILIAGARPNFMKIAPLIKYLKNYKIIFTGQHYGEMAQDDLLPKPDYNLNLKTSDVSEIQSHIFSIFYEEKPDLVIVVGDVNSSLAGARAAYKLSIKLAHVEAGLRSFDNSMPEERNRIEIDKLSDYLFVTEPVGIKNLKAEGITKNIFLVGNTMIDSLIAQQYAVLTLHRPSNVDNKKSLMKLYEILTEISKKIKIIFPIHPRTCQNLIKAKIGFPVEITDPLPYQEFIKLVKGAKFILTDSGGIQEETTYLKIPCLTLRENTERPITIEQGSNILTGLNQEKILKEVDKILNNSTPIDLWDGKASERICEIINRV